MHLSWITRTLVVTCGFLLFLLALELAAEIRGQGVLLFPRPSLVLQQMMAYPEVFLKHTLVTLREILDALILAGLISLLFAWLMVELPLFAALVQPFLVTIKCIPIFALAPLMVLCFGWSHISIVIPTALMIFFQLCLCFYRALDSTPKELLEFFSLNEASKWQVFWKLRLPWGVPQFFTGLRLAVVSGSIGAIAGEWAGGQQGLGIFMLECRRSVDLVGAFAGMVCLVVLSLGLYGVICLIEWLVYQKTAFRQCVKAVPLLLLSSLSLIMCSSCESSSSETDAKTTMLLDWLPNPNHIPLFAGVKEGIFREEGIDLEILKIQDPGDSIPLLVSGSADIALTYSGRAIAASSRGFSVSILGYLFKDSLTGMIVLTSSKDSFEGKVAGCSLGSTNQAALETFAQNQNIQFKDLKEVAFDLVISLSSGLVDCIAGVYPNIELIQLQNLGFSCEYLKFTDFGIPNAPELLFLTSKTFQEKDPGFRLKFQKALQKSIDFSREHPERAYEAYIEANPEKRVLGHDWEELAWKKTTIYLADNQEDNLEQLMQYAKWMREHKLLKNSSDCAWEDLILSPAFGLDQEIN